MNDTVFSFCDRTGNMVLPWLNAGYRAVTVDLKESLPDHPLHYHIRDDIRNLTPEHLYEFGKPFIIFAFPPCTHLAVSGAKHFQKKGMRKLLDGLEIVEKCRELCEATDAPWMLENPVGTLATYWRDPDYYFDPNEYGDPYTKKTCIWCGNGFVMPPKIYPGDMFAEPTWVFPSKGSMMHTMGPSEDRGDKRSVTPMGFAEAVFRVNSLPVSAAAE